MGSEERPDWPPEYGDWLDLTEDDLWLDLQFWQHEWTVVHELHHEMRRSDGPFVTTAWGSRRVQYCDDYLPTQYWNYNEDPLADPFARQPTV